MLPQLEIVALYRRTLRFFVEKPAFLIGFCVLLAFIAHGYSYGLGDDIFLLPYLESYHWDGWSSDYFVQSLHLYFPSLFLRSLTFIPFALIPYFALIFHAATYIGIAYAFYFIGKKLSGNFGAFLFLTSGMLAPNLLLINNADTFLSSFFDHTTLAIALILGAFAVYIYEKINIAAWLLVAAWLVHPLMAGFMTASIGLALIWRGEWSSVKTFSARVIIGFVPAVFFLLFISPENSGSVSWEVLKQFGGALTSWSAVPGTFLIEFSVFIILIFFSFLFLLKERQGEFAKKCILPISLGFLFFAGIVLISVDIGNNTSVGLLKLIRSSFIISLVGLCMFIQTVFYLTSKKSFLHIIAGVALIFFIFSWKFTMLVVATLLILNVLLSDYVRIPSMIFISLGLTGIIFVPVYFLYPTLITFAGLCLLFLFVLTLTILAVIFYFKKRVNTFFVFSNISLILIFVVVGYGLLLNLRSADSFIVRGDSDWKDIQLVSSQLVPLGELVQTPINKSGFRVFSKHSPYLEYSDFGAVDYNKDFVKTFIERFNDIERDFVDKNIDFKVLNIDEKLGHEWNLLYENSSYKLYRRID